MIGDIAFVFIEVLMVALILDRLLNYREKHQMLKKLNMVIGAFFSEVGQDLMRAFSQFDPDCSGIKKELLVSADWSNREFKRRRTLLIKHACAIDIKKGDIASLKNFLVEKRHFLLNLLENPNLLEHETFTNLLWAVFHLTEELTFRKDIIHVPAPDAEHMANDIKRAYKYLILEWLTYMQHLKKDYPYLFSLAARTNPFNDAASVYIQ